MNGAESLVHTLLGSGVDTCFANPGTSEMHVVAALDRTPSMHCVLALFEGVAAGAADGYGRIARRPAACLLHCGPGLANGLAHFHNARRAGAPVVAIIGDQATYHRPLDPPLAADVEGWARGVSVFVRSAARAAGVGADAAQAVQAACTAPGGVATLILPSNTAWDEGGVVASPLPVPAAPSPAPFAVENAARALRSGAPSVLLLGGAVLAEEAALFLAAAIAAASGAKLMATQFVGILRRGRGRPVIEREPYPVDDALAALAATAHLILINAPPPVGFFAYPGKPGRLVPPDCRIHLLARPDQDGTAALAELAQALAAPRPAIADPTPLPEPAPARLDAARAALVLARLLPEEAVVVDEGISLGPVFFDALAGAAPHDWLQIPGGAIGGGLPIALGAAVAAPGRRVVALQADGSAMYTPQALWTMARERLDVTVLLLNNGRYAILRHEFANLGANPGAVALGLMDLDRPEIDWPVLARGMGVAAARATTTTELAELLGAAFASRGPFLIDLPL